MARINIEECWWADLRRSKLSKLLGSEDLADAAAIRMWRLAQDYWKNGKRLVPVEIWAHFEFGPKCVEAGLAVVQDSFVYVRGSSEHLSWAAEQRENAKKAGELSAKKRKEKLGTSQPIGGKGQKRVKISERQPNDIRTEFNGTEPSGSVSVSVSGSVSVSDSESGKFLSSKEQKTKSFIAGYCKRFKEKHGVSPVIQGKESGIAKRLADGISPEKIDLYLDAFFAMPDAALHKAKHPLPLFELKKNEVVVFAGTGAFTTSRQAQQADDFVSNTILLDQVRRGVG